MTDDISAWFRWIAGVSASVFGALLMIIAKGLKDDVRGLKDGEREMRELIAKVNERIDAQRREDDQRLDGLRKEMNSGFKELRGLLVEALTREGK